MQWPSPTEEAEEAEDEGLEPTSPAVPFLADVDRYPSPPAFSEAPTFTEPPPTDVPTDVGGCPSPPEPTLEAVPPSSPSPEYVPTLVAQE